MSFDIPSVNGKKKTKKVANIGNSSSSDIISSSLTTSKSQTNRIGPRVYKCVILGDGGVGKSGEFDCFSIVNNQLKSFSRLYLCAHAKSTLAHSGDDVKCILMTTYISPSPLVLIAFSSGPLPFPCSRVNRAL